MNTVEVTGIEVTNTRGNHNKFYRVYVFEHIEIRAWGRIGTAGQKKRIDHNSLAKASLSAKSKIDEEIIKGYGNKIVRQFGVPTRPTSNDLDRGFDLAKRRQKEVQLPEPEPQGEVLDLGYQQVLELEPA